MGSFLSPHGIQRYQNHFGWTRMIKAGTSHCTLLLTNECPFELESYKNLKVRTIRG